MHLKRLELHGFKSFAARTVLEFSPGVTAIVGPNGSGKSNLADGIRWVLGEQSMRQLRGKKSDDVIFAGAQARATMQMAEVGLVLDNSASWLPSEFAEVAVARRSFRNGESEYLISGQRVRLKDVTMLLAQARVGHDSYTVIGQGLIDQALSLRAEERRGLFEDAAGIRQFQQQRNEAEQRLTLTQSNLARLRDILGEIEPRLGPLAEQARRAREFSGARDELLRLLRIWYRRQWRELAVACERAEASESDHAARITKLQDALAVEEALILDLRQQREALVGELARVRRERNEAAAQTQVSERELAVARERLAALERQQADLAGEQEQQSDAVDVARAHLGGLEAQVARAEAETKSTSASLETLERALHTARQGQEREEARLRAAQRDAIQAQARLGAAQTELGRLQKQLGERNRVLAARRDAAAAGQSKLDAAQAQLEERRREADAARAAADALAAGREALNREIADGQVEAERLRAALADAQRERSALGDRLTLLEDWRRGLEGFDEGVRALLQASVESRPTLAGVVAQLISVPPGMELALETALGPLLHAIVVPTAAEARQAGAWLRAARAGRAVFVWLDLVPGPWTPHPDLPEPDGVECIGYARDLITCAPDLRAVLAHLLGDTYLVRDLAIAERHWSGIPLPGPIVTLDGDHLHPRGWMRAGAVRLGAGDGAKESSMLARERELRQLPTEIERLDGAIADLQAQHARALALQGERRAKAEKLRKEHERAEAHAQETARAAAAVQREQERAQGELQVSQTVAEQLGAEVRGIEQEVAATIARVAEQEQVQREAAEHVEDIQVEVDDLLAEARAQQEELARARTAAAVQLQEVKALGQRADQIRTQTRELELQMGRRAQRLEAIQLQQSELAERIAAQEETLGTARERLRELGEQLQQRDTRQAELERQALELERGQSHERAELARLEAEYRRCIVDAQRARDAIEALAQQIREELGSEDEEADDDGADAAEAAALSADEAAKMRERIDRLRGRIKHLGGYDPEAPQAYEELKTRYDFLTSQVRDMEQASTNLRAVIAELDTTMRRQFEETFHAVNERFQRNFTTLFSGGAARLELTAPRRASGDDEEDDEEREPGARLPAKGMGVGGVEVFVQIPGKRAQDLSLLSGGERAMVSAALLFSLLETNPPPFCLLDEVDAALDEANVTRFCDILKQLAEKTQFMVITHNRVTMTYADAIYGVSMEGAVSRMLSMRLAEAVAVAR